MRHRIFQFVLVSGISVAALLVPPAQAQVLNIRGANGSGNGQQPAEKPKSNLTMLDGEEGKEMLQGTSIKDSEDAFKKIRDAQRMESLKDWSKAAEWYQEVMQSRDKLIPLAKDKHDFIYQYTSVRRAAMQALSKWPADGLQAYRNLYEATAAGQLAATKPDDAVELENIFQNYFITEPAKQAGIQLINLYLESGEFAHAIRIADTMLELHPNLIAERPQILFLDGLAAHWASDEMKAEARLKELQDKYADTTGVLYGKDAVLAKALSDELQKPVPSTVIISADSYPTLGGDMTRSTVSSAKGRPGALIARLEYASSFHHGNTPQDIQLRDAQEQADKIGQTTGVIPAVDRGEMFFQDGTSIYAISLESGMPLTGWQTTYPDRKGRYTINRTDPATPRSGQCTLSLTENCVFAVLGPAARAAGNFQIDPNTGQPVVAGGATRLVCLDRENGKEKWTIAPAQLPDKEKQDLKSLDFSGSPLVVGDRVYTLARGGADNNSENCYVVCLDIETGQCLWTSFVASSDDSAAAMYGQISTTDTTSHLAFAGGRVFVLSNLGAVAALDAYTGIVAWLDLYPRTGQQMQNGMAGGFGMRMRAGGVTPQNRPWEANPIIVAQNKVFSLPADGNCLSIYDATTGAELKRLRLSKLLNATELLAVLPDRLLVVGQSPNAQTEAVMSLDWANATEGSEDDAIQWVTVGLRIIGRPFVTRDCFFVPCENCLEIGTTAHGNFFTKYPLATDAVWSEAEGPGNVVVTQDQVIIAGAKSVNVYADLTVARAKLDADVADRPNDAQVRLRYAEVMFAAGHPDLSLDKLEESVKLLGGRESLTAGEARDRLFNDTINFAEKLAREKSPSNFEFCDRLFDYAVVAANSPQQQVGYRTSRARFYRNITEREKAVALYQQILASTDLRNVTLLSDEGDSERAAAICERSIREIIKDHADVYAPYEKQAADALDAAKKATNADAMIEVAEAYPNSAIAKDAMLAAAGSYEAVGNARASIHVLSQATRKFTDPADVASILEAMARNKLATPMPTGAEQAAGILLHASRQLPSAILTKPLKLPDGTELAGVSLRDAAAAVKKFADHTAHPLPDIHIPGYQESATCPQPFKPDSVATQIDGIDAIITTPFELRNNIRYDRIVTWGSNGLAVFPAGKTTPLWANHDLAEQPVNCTWTGDDLLVWSAQNVALLDGATGASKWKTSLKSLGNCEVVSSGPGDTPDQPAADPNGNQGNVQVFAQPGMRPNQAVMIQRMQIIRARQMGMAVQVQPAQPAATPDTPAVESFHGVWPVWDRVQLTTTNGRIVSLDSKTGKMNWQTRLTDHPIEQLVASDDFTIVRYNDDASSHLFVLDTLGSQVIEHQVIPAVPGAPGINSLALASDGTLVWTTADHLMGNYLYLAKSAPAFDYTSAPNAAANAPYQGGSRPDALVIDNDKIIVMEQSGRIITVHSLADGSVLKRMGSNGKLADDYVPTGLSEYNWTSSLMPADSWVYTVSAHGAMGHDTEHPDVHWEGRAAVNRIPVHFKEGLLTQSALVVVDEPASRRTAAGTLYRLFTYSRESVNDETHPFSQSGLLTFVVQISEQAGVRQWAAADGGVYYVSGDSKLHYLQGSK